ncbi:hypothetical protein EVAR_989_1 [Eumeta japonica]|uniref:Uncharacterized protein n=1 Tax=Eumeta variegata TaxID=151549 RepID=A0A4C1SEZ0_EUMVA|nr:hypothetical protein EVAR_989_1 [Eumeta japonica]
MRNLEKWSSGFESCRQRLINKRDSNSSQIKPLLPCLGDHVQSSKSEVLTASATTVTSSRYSVVGPPEEIKGFVVEEQIRGSTVYCMLHVDACCRRAFNMTSDKVRMCNRNAEGDMAAARKWAGLLMNRSFCCYVSSIRRSPRAELFPAELWTSKVNAGLRITDNRHPSPKTKARVGDTYRIRLINGKMSQQGYPFPEDTDKNITSTETAHLLPHITLPPCQRSRNICCLRPSLLHRSLH